MLRATQFEQVYKYRVHGWRALQPWHYRQDYEDVLTDEDCGVDFDKLIDHWPDVIVMAMIKFRSNYGLLKSGREWLVININSSNE